jgi:hypothetical protein
MNLSWLNLDLGLPRLLPELAVWANLVTEFSLFKRPAGSCFCGPSRSPTLSHPGNIRFYENLGIFKSASGPRRTAILLRRFVLRRQPPHFGWDYGRIVRDEPCHGDVQRHRQCRLYQI